MCVFVCLFVFSAFVFPHGFSGDRMRRRARIPGTTGLCLLKIPRKLKSIALTKVADIRLKLQVHIGGAAVAAAVVTAKMRNVENPNA